MNEEWNCTATGNGPVTLRSETKNGCTAGSFGQLAWVVRMCVVLVVFIAGAAPAMEASKDGPPSAFASDRSNILLVLSDDHSMPHLGCYGDANCRRLNLTPNLDRFAAEGMRLGRAYTAAPQCAPSRTAIFAGRSPVDLGVTRFAQPARADVQLFTDVLRKDGYWVGLDGRHQHLDGKLFEPPHVDQTLREAGMRNLEERFDHFTRNHLTKGRPLSQVGERLTAILNKVPEGKPWFLYFGFSQTHRPFGDDHEGIDPAELTLPPDWPDLPEVRADYAKFLADLRDLDSGFGLLMKALEDRGAAKDTLVVFMGDNGEALLRGKGTLFTRGTHVPLLVRWPGKITAGSTSDILVSGTDLAPTFLAAAGAEAPRKMTGHDFLPELLGRPFEGRSYVFAERGWHWGPITRADGFDLSRSVTTERYHYIYNALPGRPYEPVDMTSNSAWSAVKTAHEAGTLSELHGRLYFQKPRPIIELYDLKNDPFQIHNLAKDKDHREIERKLRIELEKWMVRESDYLPLPSHVLR